MCALLLYNANKWSSLLLSHEQKKMGMIASEEMEIVGSRLHQATNKKNIMSISWMKMNKLIGKAIFLP